MYIYCIRVCFFHNLQANDERQIIQDWSVFAKRKIAPSCFLIVWLRENNLNVINDAALLDAVAFRSLLEFCTVVGEKIGNNSDGFVPLQQSSVATGGQ